MSSKQEFYKRYGSGKFVLEVLYGFDDNEGYYLQATPVRLMTVKGIEGTAFSGSDVKTVYVIPDKRFSSSKWEDFKSNLDYWVEKTFSGDPVVSKYIIQS